MIHGIGTDIVSVARIARLLDRYGEKAARRILTDMEFSEFMKDARPAHYLAKRFAAKEAAVKAMGTGFRDGITLRSIGVDHDRSGRPVLRYFGRAAEARARLGIGGAFVSIADEEEHALAFVVLERA